MFRLGFVFGSPSHLGWHPRLDGDFPFVDRHGRPWLFVKGGANGRLSKEVPMGPCGHLSIVVVGGCSH